MGSAARTALVIALLGSAGAGAAWSVYRSLTTTTDVYTDAGSIAEPAEAASPRGVLWEPPRVELEPAREPRTSPDGATLFFVREGPGGDADIYAAGRDGEEWGEPRRLPFNTRADELSPAPMGDGSLMFVSDRAGGLGGYDIWRVVCDGAGWGGPENLGPGVNTIDDEFGPAPAGDGVVYFASNRADGGAGADPRVFDLYRADLTDNSAQAERLVSISSEADDGPPAVSPSGDFLYFASERNGGLGGSDLYRARLLGDGIGEIEPLTGINTEANERGPWLDTGGFRLWFGSDRGGGAGVYSAMSREVYRDRSVAWGDVDWASIWRAVWPWLTGLVIALLVLLILSRLSASALWRRRWRTMSLMAKCVLVSLLAHALLLAVLTAVHVTTSIGDLLDDPGETRVRLVTHAGAGELTAQVRGSVGEVVVEPVEAEEAPRADPVEVEQPEVEAEASAPGQMDVAELSVAAPSAAESSGERPSEAVRADAPALEPDVDVSRPDEKSVTDSSEQANEPSRAASRASARRAEPAVDDGSGTPIARADAGTLAMRDDGTSAGGAAVESAPNGSVDPVVGAEAAAELRAEVRAPGELIEPATAGEAAIASPGDAVSDAPAAVRAEAGETGPVVVAPGRAEVVEAGPVAVGIRAGESSSARVASPELRREVESTVTDITAATPGEAGQRVAGGESSGESAEGVSAEAPRAELAVREGGTPAPAEPAPDGLRVTDGVATPAEGAVEAPVAAATSAPIGVDAGAPNSAAAAFDVDVPFEGGGESRTTTGETGVGEIPVPFTGTPARAEATPGSGTSVASADSLEPESLALVERGEAVGAIPVELESPGGSVAPPVSAAVSMPDSADWDAPVALPRRSESDTPLERERSANATPARRVADVRAGHDAEADRGSDSFGRVEVEPEGARPAEVLPALRTEAIESRPTPASAVEVAQPEFAPAAFDVAAPIAGSPESDRAPPTPVRSPVAKPLAPDPGSPAGLPAEIAGADLRREQTEPEKLELVESRPTKVTESRESVVELALPPPEAGLALPLPGIEARLPREEAPPTLRLEGVVLDSMSREPLAGASVRLDADRADSIEVVTDAEGRFRIEPRRAPAHAAVTASAREYRPSALNISAEQLREHATVVFLLDPLDTSVVVLEDEPRVHHLGDDRFDGRINSQFQKSSEGLTYRRRFRLDADQLRRVRAAEVSMMVKGAQIENQIRINGRLVDRRLTGAPSDGSFGEFRARIPASWLNRGENTLEIRSVINRGTDHDDYEFVNVQVELIRPRIERNL